MLKHQINHFSYIVQQLTLYKIIGLVVFVTVIISTEIASCLVTARMAVESTDCICKDCSLD